MHVPVEKLIDGVMRALRDDVLPEVSSARARGRLWAALDILNNLRDRLEVPAWFFQAEAESARDALDACAAALKAARLDGVAGEVTRLTEAVLATTATERERAAALRPVMVNALRLLDGVSEEHARSARGALESHLASQALREVMALKPSLLAEISKG